MRNTLLGLILGLACLGTNAPLFSQFYAPPAGTVTSVPAVPPPAYGVPYTGVRPVYGAPGGYLPAAGGVYVSDPVSGYFNGLANLTSAYGQYAQDYQQARLMNQDVERSKMATRRALIEQQMWEQPLQPKAEDVRRYQMEMDLRRAMNSPPITDIISGSALNILLKNIQAWQAKGAYGPMIPLDQDTLRSINIVTSAGTSLAMFKSGSKVSFPFVLRDTPFDEDRQKIQDGVTKALAEVEMNELSPATMRGLKGAMTSLDAKLTRMAPDMSIPDGIAATRFMQEMNTSIGALLRTTEPGSSSGKVAAQGRSVGDLVQYMTTKGARFAASLAGEEGAYRSMHQSLVAYSNGLLQSVRR
jgi:hypothetical protein